jgi:hypothetical protein
MKTPMQQMISFFDVAINEIKRKDCKMILENLKSIAESSFEKEKEFSKDCFDAGKVYVLQDYLSYIGHKPDFDEFYSQFESGLCPTNFGYNTSISDKAQEIAREIMTENIEPNRDSSWVNLDTPQPPSSFRSTNRKYMEKTLKDIPDFLKISGKPINLPDEDGHWNKEKD